MSLDITRGENSLTRSGKTVTLPGTDAAAFRTAGIQLSQGVIKLIAVQDRIQKVSVILDRVKPFAGNGKNPKYMVSC